MPQKIFIIVMIVIMAVVLVMGFHFHKVRKKSMGDRFALEKIDTSLFSLIEANLKKWNAGIAGGTSDLIGKDGKKGHQLNLEIHVLKEFEKDCRAGIEIILNENQREDWIVKFANNPDDGRIVFNLNIYTVPPGE